MSQESAAPTQAPTNGVQVTKKPGRIKTELYEFANRRGTEYPYNDNLEVVFINAVKLVSMQSYMKLVRVSVAPGDGTITQGLV
jgi:hypothetical protein